MELNQGVGKWAHGRGTFSGRIEVGQIHLGDRLNREQTPDIGLQKREPAFQKIENVRACFIQRLAGQAEPQCRHHFHGKDIVFRLAAESRFDEFKHGLPSCCPSPALGPLFKNPLAPTRKPLRGKPAKKVHDNRRLPRGANPLHHQHLAPGQLFDIAKRTAGKHRMAAVSYLAT